MKRLIIMLLLATPVSADPYLDALDRQDQRDYQNLQYERREMEDRQYRQESLDNQRRIIQLQEQQYGQDVFDRAEDEKRAKIRDCKEEGRSFCF